jgi:microcystin-dependent protein
MKFTDLGRAAMVNARNTGTNAVTVTEIGVTELGFLPDPDGGDQTLPGERKRIATFGGKVIADDVIHVTVRDETEDAYSLRGIGLYLHDGTLLCLYGQERVILEKSSQAVMLLSADLMLADMDSTQIEFGSAGFLNPPATTEEHGVVELATDHEASSGKDSRRAVTPQALTAALDHRLGRGAPTELAKTIIAEEGNAGVRALLGLGSAAQKDDGEENGLDADLLDGRHGDFYLDWSNLTGVPASTHIPGQIVVFAGRQPPPGTLLCDGRLLAIEAYPRLWAAIGDTYGGDASTGTFSLPRLDDESCIIHTSDSAIVGTTSPGAVIAHSHGASASAAGSHAHSASASWSGDHVHGAWTDGQGHHGHGGSTTGAGEHQHLTPFAEGGHAYPWGADYSNHMGSRGNIDWDNPWPYTSHAGHHAHHIAADGNGNHAHNIGMNGAGGHGHNISVGAVGDHGHVISVGATGVSQNLPAGIRMLYCIAY